VKYAFPPPYNNPKSFVTETWQEKHGIERKCTATRNESSSLPVPKWFSKMQQGVVDETDSPPRGGSMAQKQQQILPFVTPPRPNKRSMQSNGGEIK
jgi:hypothetical protein